MLRTPTTGRGKARLAAAAIGASAALLAAVGTSGSAQASPAAHTRHGVLPTVAGAAQFRAQAAHDAAATGKAATGPETLSYGGGIDGIGVMDQHPKVYVIFYGSQWGTQGKDANGNLTFSNDPQKGAAPAQMLFKGIGTGGEAWSGTMTQYCDGPLVKTGATSCSTSAAHVPYPTGGVLAGAWYDNSAKSPAAASGHQLGEEALKAAKHFGNTTAAKNRGAYYVILSPHGTNPDNYQGQYCAWHDYNGDSTLTGGAVASTVGDFAFSNQPYNMDSGQGCGVNFLNSGSKGTLDGWTMTLGHEYSETITDQNPAGGWTNNVAGSAYQGQENADECAWLKGVTGGAGNVKFANGTYTFQGSWSNDTNVCALTHATVN
jgi:serine protease